MSHLLRPPSDKTYSLADLLDRVPRCLLLVEQAVMDLLSDFADEETRLRARDMVQSLFHGCAVCGFRESSDVLRAMDSLLSLPLDTVAGIQLSVAERLVDLVGVLKAQAGKH